MSWRPNGYPLLSWPAGIEIAGMPAKFTGTVNISFRYIDTGSSFFSPILNAELGVDGVNIASRIESLAEPNGVTISDDTYRQIKDRLNIVWVDCGTKQVKNIKQPIQTWSWASSTYNKKPKEIISDIEKDKPSIVMLPFRNLSNDSEQEFLADGISEDIISALSKFRSLFVIAKNTSFSFKDNKKNITEIARELGVRYVCEGSIRSSGNRIRVTVQLSDAQTGNSVWSDKYDGNLDDIIK